MLHWHSCTHLKTKTRKDGQQHFLISSCIGMVCHNWPQGSTISLWFFSRFAPSFYFTCEGFFMEDVQILGSIHSILSAVWRSRFVDPMSWFNCCPWLETVELQMEREAKRQKKDHWTMGGSVDRVKLTFILTIGHWLVMRSLIFLSIY